MSSDKKQRIRLRQGGHESTDAVTAEFVRRAIRDAFQAEGLENFREWKTKIEMQLQVLRIIAHDMKDAIALSYTNQGSARVKLNELLEGLMQTLVNVDELMQPDDIGELTQQQQLLNRAFDRFRQPVDRQNEAVETDDFDDPVEGMFDDVAGFETQ